MRTLDVTRARARAFLVVMLAWLIGSATAAGANGATMFPSVESQNLNGRPVKLPEDFTAPASIVFVAYLRGQQAQVDSWKSFVTGMRERFPAIGVFEIPTLAKGDAPFRWFIDGGMRRGISDPSARDSTITLYIDKKPFNEALGIMSERDITVLLVEPSGVVRWRSAGSYLPEKAAALTEAFAAL